MNKVFLAGKGQYNRLCCYQDRLFVQPAEGGCTPSSSHEAQHEEVAPETSAGTTPTHDGKCRRVTQCARHIVHTGALMRQVWTADWSSSRPVFPCCHTGSAGSSGQGNGRGSQETGRGSQRQSGASQRKPGDSQRRRGGRQSQPEQPGAASGSQSQPEAVRRQPETARRQQEVARRKDAGLIGSRVFQSKYTPSTCPKTSGRKCEMPAVVESAAASRGITSVLGRTRVNLGAPPLGT